MTEQEFNRTIIMMNGGYLLQARELCRSDPNLASVMLNMSRQLVDELAETSPAKLMDIMMVPRPVMCLHPSVVELLGKGVITDDDVALTNHSMLSAVPLKEQSS